MGFIGVITHLLTIYLLPGTSKHDFGFHVNFPGCILMSLFVGFLRNRAIDSIDGPTKWSRSFEMQGICSLHFPLAWCGVHLSLKTNMSPKERLFQQEKHLATIDSQGTFVSFLGSNLSFDDSIDIFCGWFFSGVTQKHRRNVHSDLKGKPETRNVQGGQFEMGFKPL